MKVAVCILAKDEASSIATILAQLASQSLILQGRAEVTVHVVSNGSSDATVAIARSSSALFEKSGARLEVHELERPGKSRAWNKTVHGFVDPASDFLVFLDADIMFADERVVERLVAKLKANHEAEICTGYPVKDISAKSTKSPLDLFSLAVSRRSQQPGAVNGSLYVARGSALRKVWLPDETPGEDGFLNAMVTTCGFTTPPIPNKVISAGRPTHYYEAHRPLGFYQHERRMIVGTMINIWIFEHLWSLQLGSHAGGLIRRWNEESPEWVEKLIRERSHARRWVVPGSILFRRFLERSRGSWTKQLAYLPIALAATALTMPPAIAANARLRRIGAASTW